MNPATYNELNDLLQKMKKEKNSLQKQIEDNTMQIFEAHSYAQEILNREDEDFKVFSPRKIEDIYKEELEKFNVKQTDYENRNQSLIAKREELDSIISVLEKVSEENTISDNTEINHTEPNNTEKDVEQDTIKDVVNKSVQNLTYFMHKIDLSTKFIQQDPLRAKLELETVNKGIRKVTDKLSELIKE